MLNLSYIYIYTLFWSLFTIHCVLCAGTGTDQGDELERETPTHTPGARDPCHIGLHAIAQQPDGQPEQPVVRTAGDQSGRHGEHQLPADHRVHVP